MVQQAGGQAGRRAGRQVQYLDNRLIIPVDEMTNRLNHAKLDVIIDLGPVISKQSSGEGRGAHVYTQASAYAALHCMCTQTQAQLCGLLLNEAELSTVWQSVQSQLLRMDSRVWQPAHLIDVCAKGCGVQAAHMSPKSRIASRPSGVRIKLPGWGSAAYGMQEGRSVLSMVAELLRVPCS